MHLEAGEIYVGGEERFRVLNIQSQMVVLMVAEERFLKILKKLLR